MLRKVGAHGARSHAEANGSGKAASKRTWADMRARLQRGEVAKAEAPAADAVVEVDGDRSDAADGDHAEAAAVEGATDRDDAVSTAAPPDAAPSSGPSNPPGGTNGSGPALPVGNDEPEPGPTASAAGTEGSGATPDDRALEVPAGNKPAAVTAGEPASDGGTGTLEHDSAAGRTREARVRDSRADAAPAPGGRAEREQKSPPRPTPQPLDAPEAGPLLGRVISVAGSVVWGVLEANVSDLAEIGAVVRLHNGRGRTVGLITTLKTDGRRGGSDDKRLVEVRMLGEIPNDGPSRGRFQRGVSSYPPMGSDIHAATQPELESMYAPPEAATVRLGTLSHTSGLPAFAITDNLLGKHFAVLGSTGAGKSCAVTVILRSILDANPYGHIVMLDPHNEYGRAFGNRAELLNPTNLKLPYWLLNYEELAALLVSQNSEQAYAEAAILKDALLAARRGFVDAEHDADHVTVDTPIPYRLSELVKKIKEAMGAFNRPESTAAYQHLISRIESLSSDKRYEFMFSSFLVQDTMHHVLARILRIPVDDKPITIIDISGVPSEIVDVVVSVLFRLIFEFALWSDRAKAPPLLLVCEEAHRYVPGDEQVGFAPTKRSISRIAKEGRKYGLSLGLVTQRPSELSTSSLSQCNTIFALRLSNDRDLEFVRAAVTDSSRWLTDTLPALNTQEAVVLGDGVSVPMHIRFDELSPEHRPASTTPRFSEVWQGEVPSDPLIAETVERWRYQIRAGQEGS